MFDDKNIIEPDDLKLIDNYQYFNSNNDKHKNASTYIAASNVLFCMSKNDEYDKIFVNQKSDQIYFIKKDQKKLENSFINSCEY